MFRMAKRKGGIEKESKQKKIKHEESGDEQLEATVAEITQITDMPTMGQGLPCL